MQPYVVKQIVTEDGREVKTTSPVIKRRVISQETSQILRNYLETVVTDGTGKNARVEGYTVGGKPEQLKTSQRQWKVCAFLYWFCTR